ncbi:protein of unknown function [Methylorubrum extorquens]|uniref:Uncharacterized protein n=1 Tax=Methylorubrum extorquens TaxID=408 RepID=A0A2N9APN0_METEX|nr:protein of unknown function [Methylorubrum extorquens]
MGFHLPSRLPRGNQRSCSLNAPSLTIRTGPLRLSFGVGALRAIRSQPYCVKCDTVSAHDGAGHPMAISKLLSIAP